MSVSPATIDTGSSIFQFVGLLRQGPVQRKVVRIVAAGAGLSFIASLFILVIVNSAERNSVLTAANPTSMAESYFAGLPQPGAGASRLRLQEFHRTAIKNGRMIWEVRASDAQYYSAEGITHLDRASIVLYQQDNSKIALKADAAKLLMGTQGLARAEMAGNVEVLWDSGMKVQTNSALYELTSSEISAPEWVKIQGDGYVVEGRGLRALIDAQRVTLARQVETVFTQQAESKGPNSAAALFERISSKPDENQNARP